MNTHCSSALLLVTLLGSTAALAQAGTQKSEQPPSPARAAAEPGTARAELDPRSHSYGLHARHDIRSTKTREEVRAELMEARAAEARLRRAQRGGD
jgi:hypothetical protein